MAKSVNNKCEKIAALIRRDIRLGRYPGKVPSENEIAKGHHISKATAAKVLHLLREEGLIKTVVGSGSFVASRSRPFVIRLNSDQTKWKRVEEGLLKSLTRKFPGVTFRFDFDGSAGPFDLVSLTSLAPDGYGAFAPLSPALLKRIGRLGLHPPALGLHRRGDLTFGVPHILSPTFLLVNKKALSRSGLKTPSAQTPTAETLLQYCEKAGGLSPYDLSMTHLKEYVPFLPMAGGHPPARGQREKISPAQARDALGGWHNLWASSKDGADIRRGEALAITASLMADPDYFISNPHFEPVAFPIGGRGQFGNALHSQALAISATCHGKAFAEDVIAAFFSEEIQNQFAQTGYGLPALSDVKAIHPAAPLALAQLRHSRYDYAFVGPPLLRVLVNLFYGHKQGEVSKSTLIDLVMALMAAEARLAGSPTPWGESEPG